MKMANFLASTQTFSVNLRGGYDAVQASGQKIEFGEYRTITMSRPNRLRVEGERSDGTKTLVVLTGKEIVLVDLTSKVYATTPQPGPIDDSIVYFVRDLGMRLPLAALLLEPTTFGPARPGAVSRLCREDEHLRCRVSSYRRAR